VPAFAREETHPDDAVLGSTAGRRRGREGLPDRVVDGTGTDLLEMDRVPLAQGREFFANGHSGSPCVAEGQDRRLGCPPNKLAVRFMLEKADA